HCISTRSSCLSIHSFYGLESLVSSIYLVHFMILYYLQTSIGDALQGNKGFLTAFLTILIVSSCISYFTHRYIELPGMALGKKIIHRL
ncbi:MAG: hypothetical protein Q9M23_08330, partial [Mariprofundaceae bacterium]|nr:hypothetical protein [Mariprofundaceae bacterium]